jgi:hypothetical protein
MGASPRPGRARPSLSCTTAWSLVRCCDGSGRWPPVFTKCAL